VRLIAPGRADTFLEIGPGRGALTRSLADRAGRVIAFEIDRDLAAALASESIDNLTVVEGDFLEIDHDALHEALVRSGVAGGGRAPIRIVGNLPYNIASPILFKLVELYRSGFAFEDATVMLQKEVADRLLAEPGTREFGVLTVLIGLAAGGERLLTLPPGAFRPVPKVESAVVGLRFHEDSPPVRSRREFEALVQAVFTRRRKTLANALLAYRPSGQAEIEAALARAGIAGARRPETLDVADFVRLSDAFGPVIR
jgi:16S rRNA (adenine1518-N6/adenine1519-N6)-dimethyltransferase